MLSEVITIQGKRYLITPVGETSCLSDQLVTCRQTLGAQLKGRRLKAGLTFHQLGLLSGINWRTLMRYEKAQVMPSVAALKKIDEVLR